MSTAPLKVSASINATARQRSAVESRPGAVSLKSNGCVLDRAPEKFGRFVNSMPDLEDAATLRARIDKDGYLFFRGLLDKGVLERLRSRIVVELERLDVLDVERRQADDHLPAKAGVNLYGIVPGLDAPTVKAVVHQQPLLDLFGRLFGEKARALDYSWPRVAGPGRSESTHADWVYLCRGTPRIYTTWIPLMDVPLTKGPLMILEGSHNENDHTRKYLTMDADALRPLEEVRFKHGRLIRGGRYSARPHRVQKDFGTRWLSEDFKLGDVVIFSTRGLHATLDNQTDTFRTSIDVRFQPASEPADPRFVGVNPVAHTLRPVTLFDRASDLRQRILTAMWPSRGRKAFVPQAQRIAQAAASHRGVDTAEASIPELAPELPSR